MLYLSLFSTRVLEEQGQAALVAHVFSEMKKDAGNVQNNHIKKLTEREVTASTEKYVCFENKWVRMNLSDKLQLGLEMLKEDKREANQGCECVDEVDDLPESLAGGVMYASGIPVDKSDELMMSHQYTMLLMGVTSMIRMLKEHYTGVTRPMLYF